MIRLRDATITSANLLANVRQIIKWCNQLEYQVGIADVGNLQERLKVIEEKILDLIFRINSFESNIANLQSTITTIQNQLTTINEQITALQNNYNALAQRVEKNESDIADINNLITSIKEQITGIENQINDLKDLLNINVITNQEVSSNESTVSLKNIFKNIQSGLLSEENLYFPVVNEFTAGFLNTEDYKALKKAIEDIKGLQGLGYVFAYLGQNPTQQSLTAAWTSAKDNAPYEGSNIINIDENNAHYLFANLDGIDTWLNRGNYQLPIATAEILGGIYSSTVDGQGFVNANGVLSVNGWGLVVNRITTIEGNIANLQTSNNSIISKLNTKVQTGSIDATANQAISAITFNSNSAPTAAKINIPTPASATTALIFGATGSPGVNTTFARADHTHTLPKVPDISSALSRISALENDSWRFIGRYSLYQDTPLLLYSSGVTTTNYKVLFFGINWGYYQDNTALYTTGMSIVNIACRKNISQFCKTLLGFNNYNGNQLPVLIVTYDGSVYRIYIQNASTGISNINCSIFKMAGGNIVADNTNTWMQRMEYTPVLGNIIGTYYLTS